MNESIKISALKKSPRRNNSFDNAEIINKDNVPGQKENIFTKEITLFSKPFSGKIKESFYLELYSLMEAGLDIRTALQLIHDEQRKKNTKVILEEVLLKVVNGSSFSAALKENKNFTSYEYFTIEIGEETGRLTQVFQQLSLFFKSKIKQRRQIVSALTYPMIVMSVAFCSVVFMMNFVVPMFADMFKRFGGELPLLTQEVVKFSNFMQHYALAMLLIIGAIVLLLYVNRKKQWYIKNKDKLLLRLPIVKGIVLRIYLTRFASTMGLLLGAKVPLLQAISLTRQVVNFNPLEEALKHMEEDILKGMPLHTSMKNKKIFPSKMVTLVKVGEEVNQLETFFKNLAERYSDELEYQTTQISKFIEPAIIIILGLVVGVVLIAMYLPMFNMGNMVQ